MHSPVPSTPNLRASQAVQCMRTGKRDVGSAPFGRERDVLSSSEVGAASESRFVKGTAPALSCDTRTMSFDKCNVMPGVLNSLPSSADKERKGQRTEAPGEKTKPTQRIRLQFTCAGCRQPGPAGTGLSASSGAGPNSGAVISASS